MIKAIAKGTIFDGKVDCYVLEDERRVIGVGGIVGAIGAREKAGLRPYLARLPNRFSGLALRATFDVVPPGGGSATCHEARFLLDVCRAYVDALAHGELRPNQMHLGAACAGILAATSELGIVALIDNATQYEQLRKSDDLQRLFDRLLREQAADWQLRWRAPTIDALCRLYGHPREGGRIPQWLTSPMAMIYRIVLGDEVYVEVKRRNQNPRFDKNHHQFLQEDVQRLLDGDLQVIELLANQSANPNEFKDRMLAHYRKEPLQLRFS